MLSACTRLNPAFDGGDEGVGDDDAGTTVGSGTTVGPGTTSPQGTRGSEGNEDDEASESRVDSLGSAGSSTSAGDTTLGMNGTDSGSSSGSDTGEACVPSFDPPYDIEAQPSFDMLLGECPPSHTFHVFRGMESDETMVVGSLCDFMCPCIGEDITMLFDVPLPPLTSCFDLVVEFQPMSCEVAAYMIEDEGMPRSVVSNVLSTTLPFSFERADEPTTPCGEGCDPPSGEYAVISSFDGTVVPPDGNPVPFLGEYSAFNHGSGIAGTADDCREVGRWYVLPAG